MERPTLSICILSLALCVTGGFQQGYIASVLNPPYVFIEAFINETVTERFGVVMSDDVLNTVWSFLNVMFPVASIVGQFLAAWMCKRFGRKGTAIITCILYLPGTILSSLSFPARSFEMLFIGRFLWSLGNGINAVNATVWIVECAPTSIRGAMGAMQEFSMAIGLVPTHWQRDYGSLVCQALGVPFSNSTLWPWIFAPNAPLVLLSIGLFWLVPDSPVSIIEREGDIEKARASLSKYYGISPDALEIDRELNQDNKKSQEANGNEDNPGILWIFNPFGEKEDRMRVIQQAAWLGVAVKIAYVFTGARALRAYSTFFLYELAHFSLEGANLISLIISLLRIPFTLVPVFFVDRLGRRPLMNWSLVITVLSLVILILSILIGDSMQIPSAISFAAILLINAAGLGSVSRFYAAELVPRSLLLNAVSILAGFEALTKILVEFAFYPVANVIGVYSMLMFLVPSVLFLVLIWALCPETSNRSVHQVLDDIAKRKNLKVSFTK